MPFKYADVNQEYEKNKQLRREDVNALREWMEKQPHLPSVSELHLIWFLQSCYCSNERAKTAIDNFFTLKPMCPEYFSDRDPFSAGLKAVMEVGLYHPLPKATPEGYRVIFCKLVDLDPNKYIYTDQHKLFDMSIMLSLAQQGTAEGFIMLFDMEGLTFAHMTKLPVMAMRKFLYYLQEAMPVRLKGMHIINVVSFMDKVMAIIKPFMKKELLDMFILHTGPVESIYKVVPQEILPKEYGGTAGSISDLHEEMKKQLMNAAEFFKVEEKLVADESKRLGKPKKAGDIFGVEGSFKKLDLD